MSITIRHAVSDPGRADRANEDGWGSAGDTVWIIDGATGLGDERLTSGRTDAAWLTAALDEALRVAAADAADPAALLAAAAASVEARFVRERRRAPREHYEMPTAAVLVACFRPDGIEIADLGDCGLYIASGGEVHRFGGTEQGRAIESANARRMMAGGGGRSPEVLAFLRTVRNQANTPGGYAIFAPDGSCATRARRSHHPASRGTALFLSDGFEAAVEDYGLHTGATLLAAAADGLDLPLVALREVERNDAGCTRFPRFKPSDDATAVLVEFDATG